MPFSGKLNHKKLKYQKKIVFCLNKKSEDSKYLVSYHQSRFNHPQVIAETVQIMDFEESLQTEKDRDQTQVLDSNHQRPLSILNP